MENPSHAMELDTGAAVSLVLESTYQEYWPDRQLQTQLSTYSGEPLGVLGTLEVEVQYEELRAHLPLFVLKGEGPSLFGRNWLESVRLDWKRIHQVQGSSLRIGGNVVKPSLQPVEKGSTLEVDCL